VLARYLQKMQHGHGRRRRKREEEESRSFADVTLMPGQSAGHTWPANNTAIIARLGRYSFVIAVVGIGIATVATVAGVTGSIRVTGIRVWAVPRVRVIVVLGWCYGHKDQNKQGDNKTSHCDVDSLCVSDPGNVGERGGTDRAKQTVVQAARARTLSNLLFSKAARLWRTALG
jgi:nucleoside phosphorylase